MNFTISMIAAIGKNRELGAHNTLLWNIPEDMIYFREMTKGKAVLMGRKTFESIGKPLPNRMNFVLSREKVEIPGVTVVSTLDETYARAREAGAQELVNIGGASVYALGLRDVDTLHLTHIDSTFPEADTFFPAYEHLFKKVSGKASGDTAYCYEFCTYKRVSI